VHGPTILSRLPEPDGAGRGSVRSGQRRTSNQLAGYHSLCKNRHDMILDAFRVTDRVAIVTER
jgi:hypothetical protein